MEFLLVSDIHAEEFNKFATIDPETGMNSRLKWTLDIFDQIYDYGEAHGIRTLFLGGDIFDKRGTISVPVYDAVFKKLKIFYEWNVISIVGNHDQAIKSGEIHSLSPLPMAVVDSYGVLGSKKHNMRCGLISFCETPADFLEKLQHVKTQQPDFYLIHQGVNGAKIAGDEILSRDETNLADIRAIVGPDAWVFSGHYHIHQFLDDRFLYIGSSTPKDFGDNTPKGFLHFKDGEITQIESRAPRFVVCDASAVKLSEVEGNYVQFVYEGQQPDGLEQLKTAGWVAVPKKVEREYDRRSNINPEHSPMQIIRSYVEDHAAKLAEKGDLSFDKGAVLERLNSIVGTRTIEQNLGGHKIHIQQLIVTNFMSYSDAMVDFEKYKGLVSIEGDNRDDPSAVSNGAGKSLIPEAVKWALFGSTARGVTGDDVVNRISGKNCCVELWLKIDDNQAVVRRYRKHKELKNQLFFDFVTTQDKTTESEYTDLRGKTDAETQQKIIKALGIDENTFDNTVFFGHNFTKSFAALTDKEQKGVLETILGVEYFTELFEKTKCFVKEAEQLSTTAICKLQTANSAYTESNARLESIGQKFEDWEAQRDSRVKEQREIADEKADYVATMSDNSADEATLAALKADLASKPASTEDLQAAQRKLADARKKTVEASQSVIAQNSDHAYHESVLDKLQVQSTNFRSQIVRLNSTLEKMVCSYCDQSLPKTSTKKVRDELNDVEIKLQETLDSIELKSEDLPNLGSLKKLAVKALADAQKAEAQASADLDKVQSRFFKTDGLKTDIAKLESKLQSIYSSVAAAKKAQQEAEKWAAKFSTDENPLASEVEACLAKRKTDEDRIEKLSQEVELAKADLSVLKFWEAAFSDKGTPDQSPIKSYLFDAVVPVLDELSRIYSEHLTSGSIEVQFNTVTALKSGELRDKFSVDVVNRFGANAYLGDSGGERRKVDLVIMFALHSLARIRSGAQTNLLFLDEILDSLDSEGCARVMDLLSQMTEEIESIFVITHNENLKTRFANRLKVFKKNGISRLAN